MKAMIFAAGLGTRLKPLTDTMPKALVPIAGKTLLQWQIEKLRDAGIEDIIVNVHHFPDQIIAYLQQHRHFGCHIEVSDERDCLLDTGGGLRKAWQTDEPILALNVDILSNICLPEVMKAYHEEEGGLLVVSRRETQRYLLFDDAQILRGWTNIATHECRPATLTQEHADTFQRLAFSGLQILSPHLRHRLQEMPQEKFSLIDFYLHICSTERLHAFVPTDYRMMDVGKIDHLKEAEQFALNLCHS
ncbi:MAG: nucleotidyltransferase family protein [Paludibacteraceae bacterium]|nr:nucleotidyltransferase family protein [Paludibacteraceae bacterium]